MPLNFPTTGLTANETQYTFENNTWIWNGYAWDSVVTPNSVGLTAYVRTWNGQTGDVVFSNYVTSINGTTGAVTNIAKTDTAQTFTEIQSFASGFTAHGATFNNNLYAGTIKGGQLNVQNTNSNIIGDYTNALGGGYIQIDNSSGQAVNRIAGTLYTDAVRIGSVAVPALNVTGSIYTSGLINTTARVSCAGITSSGVSTFTGSLTSNNLYVSQGATFAATVAGATANFTGLVSSTVGFSGAGTNLIGNASGLTAGTSTKSIITDTNSSSTHYPVFVSATGNTGLNVDSSTTPLTYVPSTGTVTATTFAGTNSTVSNTLSVATIQEYISGNGISVTSLARFSAGLSAAGGITFGSRPTFTAGLTTDNLYVTNGATFTGQVTVTNFKANTIGGDEGGQIDLGIAATNTTLSSGVSIDIYQNRLRFFESGGTNRGAYIDLSAASAGVGSNLLSGGSSSSPPLASASVTGVASFGNEFVVSAAGAVSLTANYVKSVNGSTGAVVSIAVTGANTFTGLQTMNAGLTANNLWVTNGATFAARSSFNAGITASNLYVGGGATFAGNTTVNGTLNTNSIQGNPITIDSGVGSCTIGDVNAVWNGTTLIVDDLNTDISLNSNTISLNSNTISLNGSVSTGVSVTSPVYLDDYSNIKTYQTTTTATTANQTIATISDVYETGAPNIMHYPAFEATISAQDTVTNKTEMLKMLIVQNGTDTVNTQYGLIRTGATGPVSSYSTTLIGTGSKSLRILATPSTANSTKFTVTVRSHNG